MIRAIVSAESLLRPAMSMAYAHVMVLLGILDDLSLTENNL